MPYLTLTENLKLQLSPGLVVSYDIQPGNGVGLFWDKHTHVYLLTYLPETHTRTPMTNYFSLCYVIHTLYQLLPDRRHDITYSLRPGDMISR